MGCKCVFSGSLGRCTLNHEISGLALCHLDDDDSSLLLGQDIAIGFGDVVEVVGAVDHGAVFPIRHQAAKVFNKTFTVDGERKDCPLATGEFEPDRQPDVGGPGAEIGRGKNGFRF